MHVCALALWLDVPCGWMCSLLVARLRLWLCLYATPQYCASSARSASWLDWSLLSRFKKSIKKTPGKGGLRWYKNVGLGFKTPKEAIEGGLQSICLLCTLLGSYYAQLLACTLTQSSVQGHT